jgi:hypothetical protein
VATFTPDTTNTLFQLAADLINQTGRNIFLTGKAGTGKTTFLKYIRSNCSKQMAVVAPTGVAAINAGGVTIHSFFQLPLAPFVPSLKENGFSQNKNEVTNRHNLIARMRVNNEKRKVWQQLELLIIDEISMVRCDTLDAVDTVLRHFRRRPYEKFGGVQVLFIGDMFQLPPVIKDIEWKLINEFYNSPYFFSSQVIKEDPPLYIEFNKIYRQSEEKFINLLNQVRNNEVDAEGLNILEGRLQPLFKRSKGDGYIVLTTHNDQARTINLSALQNVEGKELQYEAEIKDDFPENAYPAEVMLYVKPGAQVMFIKNDTADRGKRYFNGKIGTITRIEEDKISVKCKDDDHEIEVEKETWENIRYTVDKATQKMKEDVLGSFTQFPLRLAWAITIHKSQGLTFEKAIIDAGEAFAPGQVYVALSRCTSLDGMILRSKLKTNSVFTDPRIVQFSQSISSSKKLQDELEQARRHYQEELLLSFFDFRIAVNNIKELQNYVLENNSSFNTETTPWLAHLSDKINALQDTAVKFHSWLRDQFAQPGRPEENTALQERAVRAAAHFIKEMAAIVPILEQSPAVTDSGQHAKEYNELVKEIFAALSVTRHVLQGAEGGFDPIDWHQRKRDFILPVFTVNAYATASQKKTNSPHPFLHKQLRELRDSICSRKNLPVYLVVGGNTLDEMARYLPQSLPELRKISGFGDVKLDQYGQQFLDIILPYCAERKLSSLIHEKTPKREKKEKTGPSIKKGDTYKMSFQMYKEGKSPDEIAKERNLTVQTIEGHLARFVNSGDIKIDELISPDKRIMIEAALKSFNGVSLIPIKEQLDDSISFGQIRLVMASLGIHQQRAEQKA